MQAFSSFHFSPFILVSSPVNYRWSFNEEPAAQRIKRLEYWASEDIAPLVRHCKVVPSYSLPELDPSVDRIEDASRLIDAFVQTLPRFFNLNHLECHHFPFGDEALSQLSKLRKLRTLEVTDCSVTASAAPRPALEVTNVHFSSYCSTYGNVEERGRVGWLDVLHPGSIRQIWISLHRPEIIHLRGIATTRSLYDLSAPEIDNVSRHIIAILAHPTALEELKIGYYEPSSYKETFEPPSDYSLGALSLSSLRDYEGPHQFLSWVSTGPKLQSARLTTLDRSHTTRPNYVTYSALMKTIERETISDSLQSLTIRVYDIPEILLMAISARFVHIKELKLHAKRVDEDLVSLSFEKNWLVLDPFFSSSSPPLCRTFRLALRL
jgi:hypothetical protein